jgi:hypothetical protein
MLETIAIAALVVGGLSGAAAVATDESTVAEQDSKPVAVEVQKADTARAEAPKNPFLD